MHLSLFSEILTNVNPDLSDSELIDHETTVNPVTPGPPGSELGETNTPVDHGEGDGDDDDDDEGDGDIDEELAAELDLALGDDEEEDGDDEEEEDEEDESEEDDEDDDDEFAQSRKLLNEEIRDLEVAVMKKEGEIASSANPLIKVGFNFRFFGTNLTKRFHSADSKMLLESSKLIWR